MKEFVIKELTLKNFKGQNRTFSPNETTTKVCGVNGVGKTALYKAFAWLLTGFTDAINVKNHELYDNTKELTHETPEARVKASIVLDGEEYTLERVAKAKFSRKRGSQEWTKDASDSYCLYIDNIETSARDFASWIERNIAVVDLLPYMIIGEKFANLAIDDKAKARALLEQITGEILPSDMSGDYSIIKKDLSKYPIEQLLDRYKNELKPLKKRVETIESLLEVKEKEYEDYNPAEYDAIERNIAEVKSSIKDVDAQILDASLRVTEISDRRTKVYNSILDLKQEQKSKEYQYKEEQESVLRDLKSKLAVAESENKVIADSNARNEESYKANLHVIDVTKKSIDEYTVERAELKKELADVKTKVFDGDVCSYCGQELPFDMVEELKAKFNAKKDAEIQRIVNRGKKLNELIDDSNNRIKALKDINKESAEAKPLNDLSELKSQIANFSYKPFAETEECKAIEAKIAKLNSEMPEMPTTSKELVEKKDKLMEQLEELNRSFGRKAVFLNLYNEIESLKKERVEIGCSIATKEGCIDKCKEYIEERANIISERINTKLDDCKIVMYSRQKDGELKPDCVIVNNDGVKYATLNNSARIKLCISLQRMFCKHFGVNMPVFVDESSVFDSFNLPRIDTQTIYLFASDDTTLKIE